MFTYFLAAFLLGLGSLPPSGEAAAARPFFLLADSMDPATVTWIAAAIVALPAIAGAVFAWQKLTGQSSLNRSHVSGGPVKVESVPEYIQRPEFNELKVRVSLYADDLHKVEKHLDGKIDSRFQQLNQERRTSIAGLHAKLDEVERRSQDYYQKIIEGLAELRGEVHAARNNNGGNRPK